MNILVVPRAIERDHETVKDRDAGVEQPYEDPGTSTPASLKPAVIPEIATTEDPLLGIIDETLPSRIRESETPAGPASNPIHSPPEIQPGPLKPNRPKPPPPTIASAVRQEPVKWPVSPSPDAVSEGPGPEEIEKQYLTELLQAIAENRYYPVTARRNGEQGRVLVAFVLEDSGAFSGVRIHRSSGSFSLDQAAIGTLERLGGFKPIPSALSRKSWPLHLPIDFNLR